MKSLSIISAFLVLVITSSSAQMKNIKTENVKIYGNCGMCEKTIETTGNSRKVAKVDWNKETKMATISYDSIKTSKAEILKRIALAGYDSDSFLAPVDTYNALHGCCQYDRPLETVSSETPNIKMADKKDQQSDTTPTKMTDTNELNSVFNNYFEVKDALVASDGKLTATKAGELVKSLDMVNMNELKMDVHMVWMKVMKDLKTDANKMAKSKDNKTQRTDFISLSNNMYSLLKVAKYNAPVYYQHCPMANDGKGANWLSKENVIKNPYFGSMMMSCGKVVETIK